MKLIIQIPCFNEEKTLPQTFADLPKSIEGIDTIEYLIIDDGSADRTVEVARNLGINHIVSFKKNKGLARGFMAGIDAGLSLGADIIVNTDADNQYCGTDIAKLVTPIIKGKAEIVIGERPIEDTSHFSWKKKKFQQLGSWVVRLASNTNIPDAPSGFRAYSREAALRLNVINEYTYTLETIIQAGHNKTAIISVPIRTNEETRPSKLFSSMWTYIKRSAIVIIRSYIMYKPLRFFVGGGTILIIAGAIFYLRFFIYVFMGEGSGYIKSMIFATFLILLGSQSFLIGILADIIASNRKLSEEILYRLRKFEYDKDKKSDK